MPVVDGERGRAFDLRDRAVTTADVTAAIRQQDASGRGPGASSLTVRCSRPTPVHERVGVLEHGRTYPLQTALALVARSRGLTASVDDELADVRERLDAIDPPDVSLASNRRELAETDDAADLEERVTALRGQLSAARDRGDDATDLADARTRAVADLAERETERLAAEQSLERARERARSTRDRREERLRLEDRERNLQHDGRRELAERVAPAFERALASLPVDATPGATAGSVVGPDVDGALAVCRLASVRAPVVLAVDRFPSATAAAAALDAPVVMVEE